MASGSKGSVHTRDELLLPFIGQHSLPPLMRHNEIEQHFVLFFRK